MPRVIHLRIFTGPRPGKTCLTRERPGRPSENACGAELTLQDCVRTDFAANVKCDLDWARGTDLSICPDCLQIFRRSDIAQTFFGTPEYPLGYMQGRGAS